MKKVLLIINASAGTGTAKEKLFSIVEAFSLQNCAVTVYPVLPEKGITSEKILREAGDRFDIITAFGGDGTLSHVINDYMHLGLKAKMGYFPAGSTNDFARSLGIPMDVSTNAGIIATEEPFYYDIGRFNDTYFNYVAAFGAFTGISYGTPQEVKRVIGHAAYVLNGMVTLGTNLSFHCPMEIEHDGIVEKGQYLYGAVSNATSIGGFKVPFGERVTLDDGKFEVMLIKAPPSLFELQNIAAALAIESVDSPYVELFQASELTIRATEKTEWTIDGEYGGNPSEIRIRVVPKAIPMITPGEVSE